MKPRVLLLNPPGQRLVIRDLYCSFTSRADYLWPPIDLLVLSGLLQEDCEVRVLDAVAEKLSPEAAQERALSPRPQAVIALAGSASWRHDAPFLEELKRKSGCRLLITGDLALDPELWLLKRFPWIDALIRDFTSLELSSYLLEESAGRDFADLARREEGAVLPPVGIRSAKPRRLAYPVPRHELFPLERYRLPHVRGRRFSSILTNYGCPFACSFCIQSRHVLPFRPRSVSNVAEELAHLKSLGVRELFFRDPLFEADRRHALEVCRLLADGGFNWSCNSRVDTLDEELIRAMKEAGCRLVAVGIETADERLAQDIHKVLPTEKTLETIRACHRHGIQVAGYFILGLPGETPESAERTIDFAVSSGVDFASFTVPAPDYGTPLRRQALAQGRGPAPLREFDSGRLVVLANGKMSARQIREAYRKAYLRFYFRPEYLWRRLRRLGGPRELPEVLRTAWSILRSAALPPNP